MTLFMKTKKKSSGDYFTGKNIGAMEMIGPYKLCPSTSLQRARSGLCPAPVF